MEHTQTASTLRFGSKLAIITVLLLVAAALIGVAGQPASASNSLGGFHWYRQSGQATINLTLRNQIGPGDEVAHINLALARWGSARAFNWYPVGPARSDFGFAYQYGGAPSCNANSPYRTVTFCVGPMPVGSPAGAVGAFLFIPSGSHFSRTWIIIHSSFQSNAPIYCQEFGHALGIHHSFGGTCMNEVIIPSTPDYPSPHDLWLSWAVNASTHS